MWSSFWIHARAPPSSSDRNQIRQPYLTKAEPYLSSWIFEPEICQASINNLLNLVLKVTSILLRLFARNPAPVPRLPNSSWALTMLNLSFVLSANHGTLNQKEALTNPDRGGSWRPIFPHFGSVDYVYFLTPYPHFSENPLSFRLLP